MLSDEGNERGRRDRDQGRNGAFIANSVRSWVREINAESFLSNAGGNSA